jgi:hypothetical protein
MALVHVTLDKSLIKDTVRRDATVSRIVELTGMANINQQRLHRYGIVSGEVSASKLPEIRDIENVQAVESDETKYAVAS